ncbi:cytochrome c oxidase subunit 4 [Oerskovia sp. M15]
MKTESRLHLLLAPFFLLVALVYGFWSHWEPVGSAGLFLAFGLAAMIGGYLALTAKRIDARPEDDPRAHRAGRRRPGRVRPWSWWPLAIAGSAAISFLGLALGWWIFGIGVVLGSVALVGWVFEFSRGQHAH